MFDVARGLVQRGLSVDLVLVRARGRYLGLLPDDIRLIDLHSRRARLSFPALYRYLRRCRPNVLISTLQDANVMALIAKILFGRRLLAVVRQANTFSMKYADAGLKLRMVMKLEKHLLPFADMVVANSCGASDDLKRNIPRISYKVRVIFNPVVWPDHHNMATISVDHPWFNDTRLPVILSCGRLVDQKGYSTLIRAFAELLRSRPARLVILGEGPKRQGLIKLIRDLGIAHAVDLPGFYLNPFAYMAKAQVFVLASLYEGFPNVLVQAMACGTPVVSTDCPSGPKEILEDGRYGCLVPVEDSYSLARAITETLDNPLKPDLLITRAKVYSAQASIDQYIKIITAYKPR